MVLTREDAYEILELPVGADQDSIRTSYKRLALKWHPDKHSGSSSTDAIKRFKSISKAYRRLTSDDDDYDTSSNMTMDQMLSLFKDVFFARTVNSYNGSGYDTSDDDDDDDDDFDDDIHYSNIFPDKFKFKQMKRTQPVSDINKHLTVEQINKNAEDLITEEEKEKRKAEKRRAKKKRRRERKRQEKDVDVNIPEEKKGFKTETKENKSDKSRSRRSDKRDSSSSSDEADFDPNSAFFTKVVNKKKKGQTQGSDHATKKDRKPGQAGSEEDADELDPVVLRSRQLAIKGNEMAQLGHYTAAIELFTEAIRLDPHDFRFFGNRSYCFDRIQQYDRALKDAEKAIILSKEWPKGYFRKGRALAGLRMYAEAEEAFTQVLKLDKNCEDAVQELLRVRTHQITDMGFSKQQAEAGIKQYGTVQSALDSLLAGVAENVLGGGEVYVSDDDEGFTAHTNHRNLNSQKNSNTKMDPRNPEGLTALWVGNVLPDKVDDKKLLRIFSKYGSVTSVRCLPEKFCAFINYKTKEAAGKAMQYLQGAECGGQKLLIKFPDNPIVNGSGNITIRKNPPSTHSLKPQSPAVSTYTTAGQPSFSTIPSVAISEALNTLPKQSGPVNGDECYFWRTTGCIYGDKCRNKHVPDHEGVDKKPWQKS